MAHPTHPDVAARAQHALVLQELRAEFPHLHITSEHCHGTRIWVARAPGGHPWLVASDDVDRFRFALREPEKP